MRTGAKKVFLFFLCMLLLSCDRKGGEQKGRPYAVHGKVENNSSGRILLSAVNPGGTVRLDSSAVAQDGHFEIKGITSGPQVARLSLSDEDALLFVLDTSDITVNADARNLAATAQITGSKESTLLQLLMGSVKKNLDAQSRVERQFAMAQMTDEPDSLLYYQEEFAALRSTEADQVKDFIRANPQSLAATYAASTLLDRKANGAFLDSILVAFNKEIAGSPYVIELNEWAKHRISISPGSMAPDITLSQPDGSPLSLSSLRGKYVLVDFWASWCGPCRKENPQVVALYKKYKNRGFEIFGVSLDESKDQWVNAIRKDGLPWLQVCDLQGARSVAVGLYDVQTIPKTVLLDKQGKIVSLNLRGAELGKKLRELLGG